MRSATKEAPVRAERGAAAVEFLFVSILLFTLLFAIIVFGVLFGYRQQLTQATAEGARAAVAVSYTTSSYGNLQEVARLQVNRSLSGSNRQCPSPLSGGTSGTLAANGITCSFLVYPCGSAVSVPPTGADDCLQVSVVLDNNTKPLIVSLPLVSVFTPKTLTGTYVVRLAGYTAP
jgi:Flp pilus assembly protein TadG